MLDISPLSNMWFANISSHSAGFLFILLMVSFAVQLFDLMWSYCLFSLLFFGVRCLIIVCLFVSSSIFLACRISVPRPGIEPRPQ